jgi:hypothetical protein
MSASKIHHFLPQCYLKHFTHNGTQLYLYDKQKDEIRPGNIERSFYARNRNTVTTPSGERSRALEDLYGVIENDCAPVLDKIAGGKPSDKLPLLDKYMLGLFAATQFWRVPAMDEQAEELLAKHGLTGSGHWHIEYPDGWADEMRQKLEHDLAGLDATKKYYQMMLTFEPFFDKRYKQSLESWKIYFQDPGFLFTCDNPMIVSKRATPQTILDELILPLTDGRALVASGAKPQSVSPEWTFNINMQLIKQADRYVASSNKQFLEALVQSYKLHPEYHDNTLVAKIFGEV